MRRPSDAMTQTPVPHPARHENVQALLMALAHAGIHEPCRLAEILGPSMMPDRVRGLIAGADLPDYLARAIEHTLGVPLHWLDEPQPVMADVALRLLPRSLNAPQGPRQSGTGALAAATPWPVPEDA